MAIEIMTAAWKVKGLSPIQKLVLLDLSDTANADGVCWPSVDRIIERSGASRASVQRALGELEALSIVTRTMRHNKSTLYTIRVGGPQTEASAGDGASQGGGVGLSVRPPGASVRGTEPSGNRQDEPSTKKPVVRIPAELNLNADAFESWLAYHRKIGKPYRVEATVIAQAKKLARFGSKEIQALVVQQSIDEGWAGLFDLKTNAPAKGPIPAQLWDAESEQWVATHGLPKWKIDKLIKQAEDSKAFESTFAGTAPVKRDGGAAT